MSELKEIWKDVKGYEGYYKISSFANVKSMNYRKTGKEKLLKQSKFTNGYLRVVLSKNGKVKNCLVHRIFAEAFIPNPNNYPMVNHKDEIKDNISMDNLEWCTRKYNVNYGTSLKRSIKKRSKKVYQYDLKGNFIKEWESARSCEKEGFKNSNVSACCLKKRRHKTYKGYIWRYEKI